MAIIYSYPTVAPTVDDLVLGTDVNQTDKPTKNFTVQSLVDLVAGGVTGLGATIESNPSAKNAAGVNQSAIDFTDITGNGTLTFPGLISTTITNAGAITTASATATGIIQAGTFQTGSGATWITTVLTGFTSITTTGITLNGTVGGTALVQTVPSVAGGSTTKVVSEKGIIDYVLTNPTSETLAEVLANGDVSGGTNNIVMQGAISNITFQDSDVGGTKGRVLFGNKVGGDLEIHHDGIDSFVTDLSTGDLRLRSDDAVKIQASTGGNTLATFTKAAGVDLYFNNVKKLETTATGVVSSGITQSVGTFQGPTGTALLPTYSFSNDLNTGIYNSTADTVAFTSGGVISATISTSDFVSESVDFTVGGQFRSLSTAQASFGGKVSGAIPTAPTDFATKAYVDAENDTQTFNYKDASATTYQLNLFADKFQLAGGSNITTVASTVNASDIADVTFNLDNTVTITGTMKADTFTTTAGTATWVTTVLDGFTAITSDLFTGPLAGNASTASALLTTGTINMTSTTGATLGPTASAVTYTNGGNISLVSVLAASTVTSKLLTGISFSTGTNVAATDTILEGVGKLQKQITDLPAGLDYVGTWDASGGGGGVPDLTVAATHVPGQYYICSADSPTAGTFPNGGAVEPSEWKIGDWCIRGDAQNDVWQKIDNTAEVTTDGSGVSGTMPVWNNASELGSSQIQQIGVAGRTVTTIVDGGAGGDLTVQGNTLLGSASTDTINSVGVHQIDEQLNLKKGLGVWDATVGVLAFDYGDTTDKVLTSGNGSANPPAWVNRSTWGYVESVTEGTGITVSGTSVAPVVNIDYVGTDNAILSATQYLGTDTLPDTYQIWFNNSDAGANTVGYALISDLPFDNYQHWILSDGTSTATITSTNTAEILGGTGITSTVVAADKSATLSIDTVGTDNAIEVLTAATGYDPAVTGDFMWFSDISDSNTLKKSTLADLPFASTLSGTQYTLPMFATTSTLGDSMVTQNAGGTAATISGTLTTTGSLTSTLGTFSDKVVISSSGNPVLTVKRTNGNPSIAFGGITGDTAVGTMQVIGNGTDFGSYYFYSNSGTLANSNYLLQMSLTVDSATDTVMTIGKGSGNKGTISCEGSIIVDIDKNNSATGKFFSVVTHGNTGSPIELLKVKDDGIVQMPDYGSGTNTGTPTYNLEVDSSGNIIETSSTPGGSGGGIFSGDQAIAFPAPTVGDLAFTLNRATTGTLIFDVWFTSETSTGTSVAKKYTVAHAHNATPVYNKIIDTGPLVHAAGDRDFTVSFQNAGSGLSVTCNISAVAIAQNIGYTVQVGHDSTNALTFTPAS